ncbi:MAG: dTMP kinase [Saprospirales bacterium]|nr:MAG: dTMP kinase [Saprospirales bacterium]
MVRKPLFIALEGIDGSGKSTQVRHLTTWLKEAGWPVYPTFEPTDGPVGSLIRNIFSGRIEADHRTIAGLFVADRLDHLLNKTNGILGKLEQGISVVADRYYFSSFAYQGAHMDMEWVIQANAQSRQLLQPDINLFIDVEPEACMERMEKSRRAVDLYETLENLKKVRENFFRAFDQLSHSEHIVIIDGNQSEERVSVDIAREVTGLIQSKEA